ncbi:hypothetical protein Bca52824_080808 [Brassica carinata]|uniref:Uncharacterized protein n=1 Tax=Brassica carinata TaxID=52824 RepID=A0A8X7PGS9_BRACI|nr:hypothetical protein Bca52824_080808 [Brassica carinata]
MSRNQLREERENVTLISRDGQGGADVGEASLPDFVPCRYHPGGIFEDLPALAVEQMRPSVVEGQSWENIEETRSTPSSVKALLRECEGTGVTFLIPTRSQRPWSPPLGFQCVYESYFQDETKLWFPIPRLITSYVRRRDAAISQFFNGAFRTSVTLMVTAAEIDVSMSFQTLEELTYTKSMGDDDHPDTASYPEDFVSDAREVVSHVQVSWKDITVKRIKRVLDRISRRDWRSDLLPLITGNKRRFSIFSSAEQKIINAAREMKELSDLSALIKKKLSEAKKASSAAPSETTLSGTTPREETPREETSRVKTPRGAVPPAPLPLVISDRPKARITPTRGDLTLISEREIAEPSVTGGNKKRSAPDSSASAASQARSESDGPPKKKKKKERKKKKSVEGQSEPAEGAEACETVIEKDLPRDAEARRVVDSDNSPSISLKKKKTARSHESSTLAARFASRIAELSFMTAWSSSMSARLLFPSPRLTVLSLFDKLRVVARTCPLSRTLFSRTRTINLLAAGAKVRGLEEEKKAWLREKAAMEEKMVSTALRHLKEVTHERFHVQTAMIAKSNKRFSKIRDLEKRRSEFETARSLQSQAFETKKCLETLKESGIDIPQETIDLFAEQEKEYEVAAGRLAVGGIP